MRLPSSGKRPHLTPTAGFNRFPMRSRFLTLIAFLAALGGISRPLLADVVELPKLLQNGVSQRGLTAETFASILFRVLVPSGAKNLTFDTGGGTGDCDIFVRFGAHPTENDFNKSSTGPRTKEHLRFANPPPGVWYVKLDAARAYADVNLTAQYERTADAGAVPKLLPGPGHYTGTARVLMKTTLKTGVVRYTADGTDPTALSPAYTAPVKLTADTELRAQTYDGKTARGPVLVAPYYVTSPGVVTPLQNGMVLQHRAGMAGSDALFKITVPEGMKRLMVLTRGGTGNVAVMVRKGAPPAPGAFDFKAQGLANRTDLVVKRPAAGDWFIALRGRSNFSGLSIQAMVRSVKADLVVWPDILDPHETTETFTAEDCEVQENMIAAGTHRLLRFSTESRNIGGNDVVMGKPEGNPNFEFQECHGHYHFKGFAAYALKDRMGSVVAQGRKVSFCLEDVQRWDPNASRDYKFTCEDQGIQDGWSDIYDGGLPGQWIDITGIAAGDYDLEITINPDHVIDEADYSNNTAVVPVTIVGE